MSRRPASAYRETGEKSMELVAGRVHGVGGYARLAIPGTTGPLHARNYDLQHVVGLVPSIPSIPGTSDTSGCR